MTSGKVLFLPYYRYLHYAPFLRVIRCLNSIDVPAAMVLMRCQDVDRQMTNDECPTMRVDVPYGGRSNFSRFTQLIKTRKIVRSFLKHERPRLVVVGSDLGNAHLRVFLDQCRRLGIPVLILATVGFGTADKTARAGEYTVSGFTRGWLRWFELEEIPFEGWVYGTFHRSAMLAVSDREFERRLIDHGIEANRIVVTGNPADDALFEIQSRETKSEVCALSGWSERESIVLYATECIQEIHGSEYARNLNELLRKVFEALPPEVRVAVKPHPRESSESLQFMKALFGGDRFRWIDEPNGHRWLRAAHVAVGHFSALLDAAETLGTHVIRLLGPSLPASPDVTSAILSKLSTPKPPGRPLDGRNTERVAELICRTAGLKMFPMNARGS